MLHTSTFLYYFVLHHPRAGVQPNVAWRVRFWGMSNKALGAFIRTARMAQEIKQSELGADLGRSRFWVMNLEKGEENVTVTPEQALAMAGILQLDPYKIMRLAGIPESRWPDVSKIRSNTDSLNAVDTTSLTPDQVALIENLVMELKIGNRRESRPD